ncbi:Flp family type IVb pilin [Aquibaculum sediminis]|uniref:Flp family type IVb pilin n=1 Tax=Aquibaculum sediminis TaxID=3231907 RepID=UPI00345349EE
MNTFLSLLMALRSNKSGATAIEYGLIIGLIAIVLVVAITAVGTDLESLFTGVSDAIGEAEEPA